MIDLFSTQSFDRHDISTLTFWQLHRKYLWQFVTVIIYSTKKLMDIRIALRMIWTTKVWHIQDALCKPESFRSIHRLGNKSPAPTTLDISFIFFPQQSKLNLVPRTLLWNLVTYWKQSLQQAPSIWCLIVSDLCFTVPALDSTQIGSRAKGFPEWMAWPTIATPKFIVESKTLTYLTCSMTMLGKKWRKSV